MADVQALFERFHRDIRTYYEINDTLREKKDIIVRRVNKYLSDQGLPRCKEYIQGSYKMKVGICALAGMEYDIDVGLRFSFDDSRHTAETVRGWVFEAVKGHTEKVEAKASCIRVTYADGYHVDLVCYAWWDDGFGIEQHRLAHKSKGWRPADPPKLVDHVVQVRRPFAGSEDGATTTDQFRRVVRYLKRWNDNALRSESNEKPSGLALVLLTERYLLGPTRTWDGALDDRSAIHSVAHAAAENYGRITALKPTPEGEDMFGRLSERGMADLKARFAALRDSLVFALRASNANEACTELKKDHAFGSTFPCPDPEEQARQTAMRTAAPAIIPSSSSAA
jgi:hypothetical protein